MLITTQTLTSRVTHFIFEYIRNNQLKSGEPLPSEIWTSRELKISRGIVREAFRSLQTPGVIRVQKGRSPRVGLLNTSFLTRLVLHTISTQEMSLQQMLELRTTIEVRAAELAAQARSSADIRRLRAAVIGMRRNVNSPHEFVAQRIQFFEVINDATGNPLFGAICAALHEAMHQSMIVSVTRCDVNEIISLHNRIADAIVAGSPSAANALMELCLDDQERILGTIV